jgi:hypothetical protein
MIEITVEAVNEFRVPIEGIGAAVETPGLRLFPPHLCLRLRLHSIGLGFPFSPRHLLVSFLPPPFLPRLSGRYL